MYLNKHDRNTRKFKKVGELKSTLIGDDNYPFAGSRFGSAIANVGDLQQDGFDDFVVGSPFDGPDHAGAIHIYRGGNTIWSLGNTPLDDHNRKVLIFSCDH